MQPRAVHTTRDVAPPAVLRLLDPGFGQAFCGGRGFVNFEEPEFSLGKQHRDDCDGFVCIALGGWAPVIPIRAIHAFDRHDDGYTYVRLRWSFGLLVKTFLRFWLLTPIILALSISVVVFDDWTKNPPSAKEGATAASIMAGGSLLLYGLLFWLDRRHRDIRLLMGPHPWGSSDPATWSLSTLAALQSFPGLLEGVTYGEASARYLSDGKLPLAMFCARVCRALESASHGDELTALILADPRAVARIHKLRRDPRVVFEDTFEDGLSSYFHIAGMLTDAAERGLTPFQQGNCLLVSGCNTRAIALYLEHARQFPADAAECYSQAGLAALKMHGVGTRGPVAPNGSMVSLQQLREAEVFFRQALAIDPVSLQALCHLSDVLPTDSTERCGLLERAVAEGANSQYLLHLAYYYRVVAHDPQRAHDLYAELVALEPRGDAGYVGLAYACRALGLRSEAHRASTQAREIRAARVLQQDSGDEQASAGYDAD